MEKLIQHIKFIQIQYNTTTGVVSAIWSVSKQFTFNMTPSTLHYLNKCSFYTDLRKTLLTQSLLKSNAYPPKEKHKQGMMLGSHSQHTFLKSRSKLNNTSSASSFSRTINQIYATYYEYRMAWKSIIRFQRMI